MELDLQKPRKGTQEQLLMGIANRIRQSLELSEILAVTVAEVRAFLETDRVKIYQFSPEGHGTVVAESLVPDRLPSLKGLHFPVDDIPPQARELFVRARQRVVVDVAECQTGLSAMDPPGDGELRSPSTMRYRPVDPCHVEYLTVMGVQSSVVVPIVLDNFPATSEPPVASTLHMGNLWGLLVSHHAEPRSVDEEELQFIQAVVDQVEIAIAQSILVQRVTDQALQEASINRVTALLHEAPTGQLQKALEETVQILGGSGGRLCLWPGGQTDRELYTVGPQPHPLATTDQRPFEEHRLVYAFLKAGAVPEPPPNSATQDWSVEWMRANYGLAAPPQDSSSFSQRVWAIGDIHREPLLRSVAPSFQWLPIRGLILVPLYYGSELLGCLSIFRDEVNTDELWTGWHDPDTRQLMARHSFEVWRQIRIGQAQQWTVSEVKLAQALGERFATAVKQHWLYTEVNSLNASLEAQVQARTAELRQSNEELQRSTADLERVIHQQQTLARLIAKIRESLDLETVFRTTAREVRQLLRADRVVVFAFNSHAPTAQGKIIAEDRARGCTSILHLELEDPCFSDQHVLQYQVGKVHSIPNVHNSTMPDCHLEMLRTWQVQANLVIPIIQSEELWGLMGIHQCTAPRDWQDSEVEFLRQVCAQLGVALQHTELLQQTRSQATELAQTLDELKQTQMHLLQSEKMSILGQLIAGVAHEINNPIGFIHSNLGPIREYSEFLIQLARLEAQQAPQEQIQALLETFDLDFLARDFPKLLDSMHLGTNRIREIVSALRGFSRVDRTITNALYLQEAIESTLMILQYHLKPNGSYPEIEIIRNYDNIPPIECYSGQIHQVCMNLLSNAIDALREAQEEQLSRDQLPFIGRIWIELSQPDPQHIGVTIRDNGPGIPEAIQSQLFDPFFTTKPLGKGTGLGLSISYQIIQRHRGSMVCRSAPSQGAEFTITLPITQTPSANGASEMGPHGDGLPAAQQPAWSPELSLNKPEARLNTITTRQLLPGRKSELSFLPIEPDARGDRPTLSAEATE